MRAHVLLTEEQAPTRAARSSLCQSQTSALQTVALKNAGPGK